MTTILGQDGTVKVSNNIIAEIKSFTLEQQADTIDTTVMGDKYKKFRAGKTSWQGTLECYWDETDTEGQLLLELGTNVGLELYPEGTEVGKVKYTGTAYITGISRSTSQDGVGEISFSYQGSEEIKREVITVDS